MSDAERVLELEESAQGFDLFRAPGSDLQFQMAVEEAAAQSGLSQELPEPVLVRAMARRSRLRHAMSESEQAVAGPSSWTGWIGEVNTSLAELRQALDEHILEVESPDGLFAEIMLSAPRLGSEVDALRSEHRELLSGVARAQEAARTVAADPTHPVHSLRRAVTTLLGRLVLHRQRGADLVFEAYNVDIGAAD